MADFELMESQKQCIGCMYWRGANGSSGLGTYFCHHMLDTGKRRIDIEGKCHSWKKENQPVQRVVAPTIKKKKKKKENKVKKKVKAVEDGIVFESMTEAEKYYKLAHGRIHKVTNDPNKTARGQHFVTV